MDVSIVLPTYNERENISILIPELEGLLRANRLVGEIIVVDDSSPDGTAGVALALNKRYGNVKLVLRSKKEGMGAALRDGYDSASGKVIFSMDADLAFDNSDILKVLEGLNHYDLVVGSRHMVFGAYEARKFKVLLKRAASKFGNAFLRFMSGVKVHDFSLNFRGIKKDVWHSFKTYSNNNTFMFETVLLAKHKGFKVSEIPVTFKDRVYGESKMRLGRQVPSFFLRAVKLCVRARLGLL